MMSFVVWTSVVSFLRNSFEFFFDIYFSHTPTDTSGLLVTIKFLDESLEGVGMTLGEMQVSGGHCPFNTETHIYIVLHCANF